MLCHHFHYRFFKYFCFNRMAFQKFTSDKDWNSYKQLLEILRDLGNAKNYPAITGQIYYGLYLLVADPKLFDRLPELRELDRVHSEVFLHTGLLSIKKFRFAIFKFPYFERSPRKILSIQLNFDYFFQRSFGQRFE